MQVKRRYRLRKDEVKRLVRETAEKFGEATGKLVEEGIEVLELEDGREIILAGGRGILFRAPSGLFPTLAATDVIQLRRVLVNMGAVPHVTNGADVMAPGVISADPEIKAGEVVVVVDERHRKSLAIGLALLPGTGMKGPSGKVVKNLHHVGDEVWRAIREKS